MCYLSRLMAILKKNAFSRRVPDLVTEELVAVLSRRSSFEFKQLFDIVGAGRCPLTAFVVRI